MTRTPAPDPGPASTGAWKPEAASPTGAGLLDDFLAHQQRAQAVRTDRAFVAVFGLQWAAAVVVAAWVAPVSWHGPPPLVGDSVLAAAGLAGACAAPPLALIALRPGAVLTRHAIAAGQMLFGALFIHLTAGRTETHFHVFGSLALLAVYRNWTILLTATGVVAADHLLGALAAPGSVFAGDEAATLGRAAEHLGWVLFADFFLVLTFVLSNRTIRRVAEEGVRELGQYRLTRRLSSGGMGDVFLAEHRMLKRPCAVKVVRADWAGNDRILARFEREVRATAQLRHPNTVQIYDYGVSRDGTFFYAMEYVDGVSLRAMVARYGPVPPGRAVHLLRQICGALREAHAAGLVHRDVNPSNVLVCDLGGMKDVVKLLDFGLVFPVGPVPGPDGSGRLSQHGTFVGTPEYVAPEQARGEAVDPRTDLYGFGAVAYFLLTGKPPFQRANPMDLVVAHCRDPVDPPSAVHRAIPAALEAIILRCLAKDPADRYPDAAALDADLAQCGRGRRTDPADPGDFVLGPASGIGLNAVAPPSPTVVLPPRDGAMWGG